MGRPKKQPESQKIGGETEETPYFSVSLLQEEKGWRAEVLLIQGDRVEKRYRKDPDLRAIAQHDYLRFVGFLSSGQYEVLYQLFPECSLTA